MIIAEPINQQKGDGMKKLWQEFKEFALTGNIMDLAVAVILGGAISKMVSALVDNILMPLIGMIIGGIDFSSLSVQVGEASLMYGVFIQAVIEFLIIAICIFAMVKALSALDKKSKELLQEEEKTPEAAEEKPTTEELLADILAELKDRPEHQ